MHGLVAFNLWRWIEENGPSFEPPVGNKVIWEDSQYTAMVVKGPNARRDFHIDPSDEIFFQLRGDIVQLAQGGVQRRRLARPGRAGDDHDAVGLVDQLAEHAQVVLAQAQLVQVE